MKSIYAFLSTALGILVSVAGYSQIAVSPSNDATALATALVGEDSGVTIVSATYTGGATASGTFSGGTFGIEEGVILTSGSAPTAVGPDDSEGAGASLGLPGDPDLSAISAPFSTFDASILEITFIPEGDVLEFTYVFGSEEYNEYVCSSFNDVFAFFVNGGAYSNTNIAVLPGTVPPVPVAINNVNNGSVGANGSEVNCTPEQLGNAAFFVDNNGGVNIEYDGHTVPLSASIAVEPGVEYTIRLAIADAGDGALDSGVFIEGDSFVSFVCDIDAGVISTADETTICIDDEPDPISVDLANAVAGENSQWVITDDAGVILALPAGPPFDLNGAGAGVCLIWNLTWTGTLTGLEVGNNALEDVVGICFDFSNSITVTRVICEEELDCPALDGNIGDACAIDGVAGVIVEGCACFVDQNNEECNAWALYFANILPGGVTDIYGVSLSGNDAILNPIATSEVEVHIAYSSVDKLIYAVRKDNGAYRTLDPATSVWGDEQSLLSPVSGITTAVINADGKLLIGSDSALEIYQVDLSDNSVSVFDSFAPINGGDLAFDNSGALYLATKSANGLYLVFPDDLFSDILLGSVPAQVTGMAQTADDKLIISHTGSSSFKIRNTDGSDPGTAYNAILDGEPFVMGAGDMASGCADDDPVIDDCNYKLYYTHQPVNGTYSLLEVTLNNDGTASTNELLSGLSNAHIALTPDGSTIYIVGNGNALTTYDVGTNSIIGTVGMQTAAGANVNNPPAAVCDSEGTLYVATGNRVYTVDVNTGLATQFGPNRTVNGGDLIFAPTGPDNAEELWIITRSNDRLTNVLTGVFVTLPATEINGAAMLENGNLLVADGNGAGLFKEINLSDLSIVGTYETGLALFNGDLAGNCTGDNPDDQCANPGTCYASEMIEYVEGTSSNGGSIANNRTDANQALGEPERVDQLVFVSLGYGGSITLGFSGSVPNLEGDDLEIVETTYGNNSCGSYFEFADVYVSVDGVNFLFAKTICRADNFVDISDAGEFECINYVRIANNNELSTTPDAFDVDGVVAIHNCDDAGAPGIAQEAMLEADGLGSTLTSYPNPTAGPSQVVFTPAVSGRTILEVYDMNGRSVATLFNQDAQAGMTYREDFNALVLPNGIYIYRLTTANEVVIDKFMVNR